MLDNLKQKKLLLQHKIDALQDDDSIDTDLLEELIKMHLGYIKKDEIIIYK